MGFPDGSPYCRVSALMRSGFAYPSAYALQRTSVSARILRFCVTPYVSAFGRYGNVDPFSIAYAFRPQLRSRLTLIRLTLIRNPWAYGGQVSRLSYRYSYLHLLFQKLHLTSRLGFSVAGMLPYHSQ
jgi:hypothetical protein